MTHTIRLNVNGKDHTVEVSSRRLLVDCLRYDLGLTGTKEGCSVGVCGACTVLMDGKPISSCLALALFADGKEIVTVEGLAREGVSTGCNRPSSTTEGFSAESAPRGWWLPPRLSWMRIPIQASMKSKSG